MWARPQTKIISYTVKVGQDVKQMSTEHNLGVSFEIFHQGWYLLFCKAITFISSLHECRLLLTDKNTTVCLEEQKISCIIQIMHSNIAWLKAKNF